MASSRPWSKLCRVRYSGLVGLQATSRNLRGALAALTLAAVLAPCQVVAARYAAIIVDARSGDVLYARHADKRRHPASLAKMMTLYITFEALEAGKLALARKIRVSKRAAGQTPSRLGLTAGQTIAVEDAILGLVTRSANDAATVLAEALAGTEAKFALLMTERARALGMKRTRFTNASGLHNRRQVTTARDMATLARALRRDFPQYYPYFSIQRFKYKNRSYRNHNRLLRQYPGADGVKTGYIGASGFNLVASAERAGRRIIGVVLGGRSTRTRDRHMINLLDRGFAALKTRDRRAQASAQSPRKASLPPKPKPKPAPIARPAPPAVAAVETPTEVGSAAPSEPRGAASWAIQVGAFKRMASAKKRAELAARAAPELLAKAKVGILRFTENGRRLFRVRFAGFSEEEARRACRLIEGKRLPCVLVSGEG